MKKSVGRDKAIPASTAWRMTIIVLRGMTACMLKLTAPDVHPCVLVCHNSSALVLLTLRCISNELFILADAYIIYQQVINWFSIDDGMDFHSSNLAR